LISIAAQAWLNENAARVAMMSSNFFIVLLLHVEGKKHKHFLHWNYLHNNAIERYLFYKPNIK
jgi:hypothetical protein